MVSDDGHQSKNIEPANGNKSICACPKGCTISVYGAQRVCDLCIYTSEEYPHKVVAGSWCDCQYGDCCGETPPEHLVVRNSGELDERLVEEEERLVEEDNRPDYPLAGPEEQPDWYAPGEYWTEQQDQNNRTEKTGFQSA